MNSYTGMLTVTSALYETILLRDPGTARHSLAVANYCKQMAQLMNLPDYEDYYVGGLLHDIGKIGMPDGILKSNEKLSPDQRERLKDHVIDGEKILTKIGYGTVVVNIAKFHHERVDGSGYFGVDGEGIPLCAKVAAIADSYDAICGNREYAQTVSDKTEALNRLTKNSEQYDKYLLRRFCQMVMSEDSDILKQVNL